jgi:hypothetical protein
MPRPLEVEISLDLPLTGSSTYYYLSDESHVGANGRFYHGFIIGRPKIKMTPTSGGFIQMTSGGITLVNRPNDSDHPFSGSRYTTILATPGPYYIGIKFDESFNLFEGMVYLQSITNEEMRLSLKPIRTTSGLNIGPTSSDLNDEQINFFFGAIHDQPVPLIDASHFDSVTGTAIGFQNLTTSTGTVKIDGTTRTPDAWSAINSAVGSSVSGGSARYNANYTTSNKRSVSGTGANWKTTPAMTASGTTIGDFADQIAHIMANTITSDSLFVLETATVNKDKIGTPPNSTIIISQESDILNLLSSVMPGVNYQFYIAPNQTDGNRTLFLIDKDNVPATSSAYYHALSDFEIIEIVIRAPKEIRNISLKYTDFFWSGTDLESQELGSVISLGSSGSDISLNALADDSSQASAVSSMLTNIKNVLIKPTVKAKIAGLKSNWRPGDRIVFDRRIEQVHVDMKVRSIEWDSIALETIIEGEAAITDLVQS